MCTVTGVMGLIRIEIWTGTYNEGSNTYRVTSTAANYCD